MPSKETKLKVSIGAQIKALRVAAGLNQMDLAVILGTAPAHVSMWETGRNLPDSRYLEIICDHFEVKLQFVDSKS